MPLSPRDEQIRRAHASLIHKVVQATHNPEVRAELDPLLEQAIQSGWTDLVGCIRRILNGERDPNLLLGLDDEDRIIIESVLNGLQNPATLPDPQESSDPTQAAPGLAQLIDAARRGDAQALHWLSQMAEQMTRAGGDMARLGAITKRLVDGERDPDRLRQGMTAQGESLLLSILTELGRLERH